MSTHEHTTYVGIFANDGHPDTRVEVFTTPVGYEIMMDLHRPEGVDDRIVFSFTDEEALQGAEACQYAADILGTKVPGRLSAFVRGFRVLASDVHQNARDKGFWEDGVERNDGELLALIHSEVSEVLEALREGNPPDRKLPEYSSAEVEMADVVIRIMDMAHARGWRVAEAVEAKAKYNEGRTHKHGKEF